MDAFESEFAEKAGAKHALALSAGTAAIHLALIHLGIGPGDEVVVSSLTFAASATPVVYLGAKPVFVDSERRSWNMDPDLLAELLARKARLGKLPKAVILVHLYGQSANIEPILEACDRYDVPLVEDAAEALGATYKGRSPGTFGKTGIFSFNGNKIITTSGGGMLISDDVDFIAHAPPYPPTLGGTSANHVPAPPGLGAGGPRLEAPPCESRCTCNRFLLAAKWWVGTWPRNYSRKASLCPPAQLYVRKTRYGWLRSSAEQAADEDKYGTRMNMGYAHG